MVVQHQHDDVSWTLLFYRSYRLSELIEIGEYRLRLWCFCLGGRFPLIYLTCAWTWPYTHTFKCPSPTGDLATHIGDLPVRLSICFVSRTHLTWKLLHLLSGTRTFRNSTHAFDLSWIRVSLILKWGRVKFSFCQYIGYQILPSQKIWT